MYPKEFRNVTLSGERTAFGQSGARFVNAVFENGESPLKESSGITLKDSIFRWKYPLWYGSDIDADNCLWDDNARAGVWYSRNVRISNCLIKAPKNFRRCSNLIIENTDLTNAQETLWSCSDVEMRNVTAKGDYFAMNSSDMKIHNLKLDGNYSFDGVHNLEISNSRMLSKDAFWNSRNVVVKDSFISGEYIGWNAENITFENCTIESLQGLCYIKGLKMKNCRLINTVLAFEYSQDIDADIDGTIISVMNPSSGRIKADGIRHLINDPAKIKPSDTDIICPDIAKETEKAPWEE